MAARRAFRRGDELVAVRHFSFDPATRLSPGDPIPSSTPLYRRRSLYRRRLAGVVGCPWTESHVAGRQPAGDDWSKVGTAPEPSPKAEESPSEAEVLESE